MQNRKCKMKKGFRDSSPNATGSRPRSQAPLGNALSSKLCFVLLQLHEILATKRSALAPRHFQDSLGNAPAFEVLLRLARQGPSRMKRSFKDSAFPSRA